MNCYLKYVSLIISLILFPYSSSAEVVNKGNLQLQGQPTQVAGLVKEVDTHEYQFSGSAGQKIHLEIDGRNPVFQLYQQGSGRQSQSLMGDKTATEWSGNLPENATYLIAITSLIGDSDYELTINSP